MRNLFALLVATLLTLPLTLPVFAADNKASVTKPAESVKSTQKKAEGAPVAAKKEVVDINTATEADLKAVPGISDDYAKKIIAGRPYAKKDQLVSRKILPKADYDKIKDMIIAKHPKK